MNGDNERITALAATVRAPVWDNRDGLPLRQRPVTYRGFPTAAEYVPPASRPRGRPRAVDGEFLAPRCTSTFYDVGGRRYRCVLDTGHTRSHHWGDTNWNDGDASESFQRAAYRMASQNIPSWQTNPVCDLPVGHSGPCSTALERLNTTT